MKRSLLVLAALALAACGGGGSDPADDSTDAPKTSRYSTLSESQIASSLLTLGELPSGWATEDDDGADGEGEDISVVKGDSACTTLVEDADDGEIDSDDASFIRGEVAPGFSEEIYTLADGQGAKRLDELQSALEGCQSFTSDLDESNPVLKVTPKDALDLGDDALAFTFSAQIPGSPVFTARALAVSVGDNVVALTDYGFADMALSDAEFEKIAAQAVAKVEKAASAT